jgi:hypothetical protein
MTKDELIERMAMRMCVSRLLIAAGLLALLTACESLPDEKALAVNDPAFDPSIIWNHRDALPESTKKKESTLPRVNE